MTLMPVSNSSAVGVSVSNAGGSRWISQRGDGVDGGVVALVDRLAEHVEDAAERGVADRAR